MKVAIVAPYRTVAPHFEAELEIAQRHLDAGDEVLFLSCEGQLSNCDFNIERDPSICANCRGRREHGMDLIGNACKSLPVEATEHIEVPHFHSLKQLMDWKVENFDVGYASLSSLVSVVRDPEPDLEKHRPLLSRFIESALVMWKRTQEFLGQHQPDLVYVYNGRFAAMRAVLRACQKMGVDCYLHERGCDLNHYDVLKNHLPHEIPEVESVIRKQWGSANPETRESIGASWYQDRLDRVESNWESFTKGQQLGRLPERLDGSRRSVSIFCSSDDEFVAIGDSWKNTLYPNQVEAIAAIAASMLESSPQTDLYLRVHPNLKNVDNARKRSMMALDFPNLTVVAADESIDTYALMKASDQTVTFGSSVGMEAVFWGTPSILLGPCLYQNLGGPVSSASHEETIGLLCSDLKPADDKTGALMYGHWFQTRGLPYRYFEATSRFEGKFKGHVVHDRNAARIEARKYRGLISLFR